MAKDFQRLWKDVTGAEDEAAAVRALAEILVQKDGRAFVSRLENKYTDFCIDLLDRVSHDLHTQPPLTPRIVWPGYRNTRSQNPRETGFLCHTEKACGVSWTTTGFDDNIRKDRN